MNTLHRPPHRHGDDDDGEAEPGGLPVEPDGVPMPGAPVETEPGADPAPEV